MKITDNVYFYKGRSEEKLVRGAGSSNVIVIKGERQVMIDSGLIVGGAFKDLLKAASADGIDLRQTRAVLHTHSHWDHITADVIVQKEYGAEVYAHSWGRPRIESQEEAFKSFVLDIGEFYGEVIGSPAFLMKLLLRYAGGSYSGLRVNKVLEGGEELDFGARVLACHTPGHTPDHIAYYIPDDRALVGGDLVDLESGVGADLNNPDSSYADGLASLEKVRELDVEIFLPAHGEPVRGKDNVRKLLDRMIEGTHGYIGDVKGFLARREGTLTDMFNALMPNTPFTLKAMKMMLLLTVLEHLQQKEDVTLHKKDGRHVWSLTA